MKKPKITDIARWLIAGIALFGVYTETGPVTTMFFLLVFVNGELRTDLDHKRIEHEEAVSKITESIVACVADHGRRIIRLERAKEDME